MMSKNNKRYGRIEILDYYSSFDATVFESNVEEIENIIKDENLKIMPMVLYWDLKLKEGRSLAF